MWITSSLTTVKTPTVIALGNFDGVHRGHQQVIQPVIPINKLDADQHQASVYATVVTFYPHPREFFSGQRQALLTPLDEKVRYLRTLGVEQLVLLPFDRQLAEMLPEQFVEHILVEQLQVRHISVGQDFCFGRDRAGTTEQLKAIAATYGISVQIAPLHTCQGERISSSAIRSALQNGDVAQANRLLGRPYVLIGDVVEGQQLGRTIGFPTANLKLPAEKFLPRQGVYCVWALSSAIGKVPGVMNIGYRPTVDGMTQTIEVHLLDWSGDLYGQTLTINLEDFLRPEQKFASLDDLKAQIQADCDRARSLLFKRAEL